MHSVEFSGSVVWRPSSHPANDRCERAPAACADRGVSERFAPAVVPGHQHDDRGLTRELPDRRDFRGPDLLFAHQRMCERSLCEIVDPGAVRPRDRRQRRSFAWDSRTFVRRRTSTPETFERARAPLCDRFSLPTLCRRTASFRPDAAERPERRVDRDLEVIVRSSAERGVPCTEPTGGITSAERDQGRRRNRENHRRAVTDTRAQFVISGLQARLTRNIQPDVASQPASGPRDVRRNR